MEFRVVNGEMRINRLDILFVTDASTVLVGEIQKVSLFTAFETPPERIIEEAAPLVPLVLSSGQRGD